MTGISGVAHNPIAKAISAAPVPALETARVWTGLLRAWKWLTRNGRDVLARGVSRRLKVAETVSLGEKRFVSILQVDGEQFLLGGSSSNIVLLAKLESSSDGTRSFGDVLTHVEVDVERNEVGDKNLAGATR